MIFCMVSRTDNSAAAGDWNSAGSSETSFKKEACRSKSRLVTSRFNCASRFCRSSAGLFMRVYLSPNWMAKHPIKAGSCDYPGYMLIQLFVRDIEGIVHVRPGFIRLDT